MAQPNDNQSAFDRLLKANIARVFNEHVQEGRDLALAELWTEECEMFEADEIFHGRAAISDAVGRLLERLPSGLRFTPVGNAIINHGTALMRWEAGMSGAPATIIGTDIVHVQGDRIDKLYVYLGSGEH